MTTLNATQVRKEWSAVIDSVVREKPTFIKRTRDKMLLSDIRVIESMLAAYSFHAETFIEDDGSVTIALDEIDIVENGKSEAEAVQKMAAAILEYAQDYYDDFPYWSRGEREKHIPYVFKALILNDEKKIGELIQCRHGKS